MAAMKRHRKHVFIVISAVSKGRGSCFQRMWFLIPKDVVLDSKGYGSTNVFNYLQ